MPTELAWWWIGLGVNLIGNKPRGPQMNGVVERSQGVTQQWVEPETLADSIRLQARLDWAVGIQRELYPAVAGRSRLAAFPALATPRRRYQIEIEDALWSLDRVDMFCARGVAASGGPLRSYFAGRAGLLGGQALDGSGRERAV